MLGQSILNTQILNGIGAVLPFTPLQSGEMSLDGVNLSTFGIGVRERDVDNAAKRVIKTTSVPRGDGLTIIDDYFEEKKLYFGGRLRSTTAAEMATLMDDLKKILSKQNAVLDYNIRGVQRRHVVNCTNMSAIFAKEETWHITVRPVELKFSAFKSFGTDTFYTAKALFAETSLDLNVQIQNDGTRKAPISLILVYESAADIDSVTLTNTTNGKSIRVNVSLADGDVLEIDQETKNILKNNSETGVDLDGFFTDIDVGSNTFRLEHTGTGSPAVEFDATFKFRQTYL